VAVIAEAKAAVSEDRPGHVALAQPGLLRNSDFTKFWAGETVSLIGSQITDLALPLTAVLLLQASAFEVGLLNVARYTPYVLLSLFAGVWFDRHRRRPALIGSNIGRGILIGIVPLAAVLGLLSIQLVYVVALLVGTLTVLFDVGCMSYVPGLVQPRHLAESNSKMQVSYSIAGISGPGLAGLLIGLLTAPTALVADALSYLVAAVTLIWIRKEEAPPAPPADQPAVLTSIAEGLRTVFGNRVLRLLATQSAVFNLFENVIVTLFLLYAVRQLGLSPSELGLVVGVGSAGALVGAGLSTRIIHALGVGRSMAVSTVIGCLSPALLLLPRDSSTTSLMLLGGCLAMHGACLAVFNVNALTLRQSITPNHLLGRMNASYRLLLFGTVPLGAALGGALGTVFGLQAALMIGVFGIAVPIAWIPFSPVYRFDDMPALVAGRFHPEGTKHD
jgi:MFS family permease